MNYPNGVKKAIQNEKNINFKNRGMNLENDINDTNDYYSNHDIAYIYKKPTPIKIVKVNYKEKQITEAYFEKPSTTDYNGIYKGKYIDFDAKETINKTRFPLSNIHKHQLKHLENIINAGGIGFIIVRFVSNDKTYILFGKDLIKYINNNKLSYIPIEYFTKVGYLIKNKFIPKVDYIEIINKIMEEENEG